MAYLKEIRQQQTVLELDRLSKELAQWKTRREESDTRGQYRSQLDAVSAEVADAITALRASVNRSLSADSLGEVYRSFATEDRRVIWIRNAWSYFRDKFDQRDDPALSPALGAADEVVWSCYKPFFQYSRRALPPAPLPYIDPSYVPSAIRPEQASHIERDDEENDGPLARYFRTLPIPVLSLPPIVVSSPWSLAVIGHELGHFLQTHIEPDYAYLETYSDQVGAAVQRAGGASADEAAWRRWSVEIFADWYFVATMGQWAVWAIAPWELTVDSGMTERRSYYPSPLVRLQLLAKMANLLKLPGSAALAAELGADPQPNQLPEETRRDLRIADEVAKLALANLPNGLGRLDESIGMRPANFTAGGDVELWSKALLGSGERSDDHDLRTARLVAAAAVQARYSVAHSRDAAAFEQGTETLRQQASKRIAACFEKETRAAAAIPLAGRKGPTLARLVLDATDEELFR
jgi:hypothetical protein